MNASQAAKSKVLILTTATNIGGMERVVCGLARQLAARRLEARTVFPHSEKTAALLAWCHAQGVSAEASADVPEADAPHTRRVLLNLRRFVRDSRADIVNLHYGDNFISLKDVLAVRLSGRRRCVVTVNHPTVWDRSNAKKRAMTRLASYLCDAIIVISRATRDVLLEAGVSAHKIHLIPCGVQVPTRTPSREAARATLGLPPHAFIIGSLARLVPHKGIAELIEATARIPDPDAGILLAVAGEGPERPALEALAAARLKERSLFLGRVPDVNNFYAACDVFALPSHMEGFGLVYVEAAFHGVPSVGTDVGGIPDAVTDGGTGLLVPPQDVGALASALQKLRDDPTLRASLGRAARENAHAEFTEETMADHYQKVLGC